MYITLNAVLGHVLLKRKFAVQEPWNVTFQTGKFKIINDNTNVIQNWLNLVRENDIEFIIYW